MAAIQAILNHPDGAAFIRGMMKQNNDGTTTVRLFYPKTLNPVYVVVENAVLQDRHGSLSYHKALWLHLLETAYTAVASNDRNGQGEAVDVSVSSVYNNGGLASHALEILTGLNSKTQFLGKNHSYPWNIELFLKNESEQIKSFLFFDEEDFPAKKRVLFATLYKKLKELRVMYNGESGTPVTDALQKELESDSDSSTNSIAMLHAFNDYMAYLTFYYENEAQCEHLISTDKEDSEKLEALLRMAALGGYEQASRFLMRCYNQAYVPIDAADGTKVIRKETEPFSGIYQDTLYQQFLAIEQALAAGQLVTISSQGEFNQIAAGIRPMHGYTVLGTKTREILVKDERGYESIRRVCFLQLRNPWGHTGRVYEQTGSQFKAVEKEDGAIFEVELVDVNRYFEYFDISTTANQCFSYDSKLQTLQSRINALTVSAQSTIDELLEFEEQYKACVNDLIELELSQFSVDINECNALFEQGSEAEAKHLVQAWLEKNNVSSTNPVGNKETEKDYLYTLIRLNWLKGQDKRQPALEKQLKEKIIENAGYDLRENLLAKRVLADIVAAAYTRLCIEKIREANSLSQRMQSMMRSMTSKDYSIDTVLKLQQRYKDFNDLYAYVFILKASLNNLGIEVSEEELRILAKEEKLLNRLNSALADINKKYENITELTDKVCSDVLMIPGLGEDKQKEILRHVNLLKAHVNDDPVIKQVGVFADEWSKSTVRAEQDAAKTLKEAVGWADKLAKAWNNLVSFFKDIKRHMFFDSKHYVTGEREGPQMTNGLSMKAGG